jgi:hypothetical protein
MSGDALTTRGLPLEGRCGVWHRRSWSRTGGVLGVLNKQMEDFSDFNKEVLLSDRSARGQ